MRLFGSALALAAVLVLVGTAPAEAFAIVTRGEDRVRIIEEEALLVWSATSKMEHLIHRAAIESEATDFAFLFPTPTRPTIAEVSSRVFANLGEATRRRVVHRERWTPAPFSVFCLCLPPPREPSEPRPQTGAGEVPHIDRTVIAGHEAVVLDAESPRLLRWLQEHGYGAAGLEQWLEPFIRDHWTITALRITKPGASAGMVSATLRFSFATEEPFYPYREPRASQGRRLSRLFRLFFLDDGRVGAMLVDGTYRSGFAPTWFSDAVPGFDLGGVVPAGDLPKDPWLTAFHDHETGRPSYGELSFMSDPRRTPDLPPTEIIDDPRYYPVPLDATWIGFLAISWYVRRRRRNRKAAPEA